MGRLEEGRPAPGAVLVAIEFTERAHEGLGGADLEELDRLARSAGFRPLGRVRQRRASPRPGTFLGRGKLEEVRGQVQESGAELVVLACDLPYAAAARLGEALGVRVMDRSELILEIFSRHAGTREGRLQVKVARLDHELRRLLAEQRDLDRQAGGIGVLGGPGESAAHLATRRIHAKRKRLQEKLRKVAARREQGRRRRLEGGAARVALAGYTNAGKSTLLNALVGREVAAAQDLLFTTLATTTRRMVAPGGRPLLVSDTVGFLKDLPHHLVAAFESTLVEAADAELTLLVLAADPVTLPAHRAEVERVLGELGCPPERRLMVLSQVDRCPPGELAALRAELPTAVPVAALHGQGLSELLVAVEARLAAQECVLELALPHDRLDLAGALFDAGRVLEHRWSEAGLWLRARVPPEEEGRWAAFAA